MPTLNVKFDTDIESKIYKHTEYKSTFTKSTVDYKIGEIKINSSITPTAKVDYTSGEATYFYLVFVVTLALDLTKSNITLNSKFTTDDNKILNTENRLKSIKKRMVSDQLNSDISFMAIVYRPEEDIKGKLEVNLVINY